MNTGKDIRQLSKMRLSCSLAFSRCPNLQWIKSVDSQNFWDWTGGRFPLYNRAVSSVVERLVYTDRRQIDLNLSQVDSPCVCNVRAPFWIVSNGLMHAKIFPETDKLTDKIDRMNFRAARTRTAVARPGHMIL